LSNVLFFAEIVSDVPSGVQVGFGFVAAEEPSPASASQDIAATAGRTMAPTVKRTLIRGRNPPLLSCWSVDPRLLARPRGLGSHCPEERLMGGEPGRRVFSNGAGTEHGLAQVLGVEVVQEDLSRTGRARHWLHWGRPSWNRSQNGSRCQSGKRHNDAPHPAHGSTSM